MYYVSTLPLPAVTDIVVSFVAELVRKAKKSVVLRFLYDYDNMYVTALKRHGDFVLDGNAPGQCMVCNSRGSRRDINEDDFVIVRNQFDKDMSVMDGSIGNSQTSKKISETSTKEELDSRCVNKMGHVRPGSAMYEVLVTISSPDTSFLGVWAWQQMEKYKIGVVMTVVHQNNIITLTALKKMDDFVEDSEEGLVTVLVCRPKDSRAELTPFDVNILREYLSGLSVEQLPPLSVEQPPPLSDPQTASSSKDISNAGSTFMDNFILVLTYALAVIALVCVLFFGAFFGAFVIAALRHYLWASRRRAKSPNKACGAGGKWINSKPGGVKRQEAKKDN
eukprot:GHVS01102120.1.p1 GENE.GHVS01102120.1~~GHVS01102120.1.p1  ORF type:complete len:356 (-),score=20.30 GHVS01102120.1:654-1658(-)